MAWLFGLFDGLTEKQKILKNFIAFNISMLFLFASFDDIALVASKPVFEEIRNLQIVIVVLL